MGKVDIKADDGNVVREQARYLQKVSTRCVGTSEEERGDEWRLSGVY